MSDTVNQELTAQIRDCTRRLIFIEPVEALAVTERLLSQCKDEAWLETLINRADLHECFTEYEEAINLYNDAIRRCREAGYHLGLARALTGAATVSYNQDRYEDGFIELDESADISKAIGDDWLLAQTLRVRCYMLTDLGRLNEATAAGNKATALFQKEGDDFGKLATLLKFGDIRLEQKNPFEAKKVLEEVRSAARDIGYKKVQAVALGYLATVHVQAGAHREAEQLLGESILLHEQIGNRIGIARNYNALAAILTAEGRSGEAENLYQQAYDIAVAANDRFKQTVSLMGLAGISLSGRSYDAAISYARKAHDIASASGTRINIVRSSRMLYNVEKSRGNYAAALAYLEQCTAEEKELLALEQSFELNAIQKGFEMEKKERETEIERLKNVELKKALEELTAANLGIEREKERSEQLLLNILPADVAEELKAKGSSAARLYDEVSVLFTDFVKFTSMAEKLSPQELVLKLNTCFTAFDAIIERNGLEKIKTIGDAYMAVCGLPVADPRHAQRTVQAALEIQDFIAAQKKVGEAFDIRIGINSGPVVAGIIGVKKFAYDIWGDTVNTAARMEQHSEPGRINISQSTHKLVKGDYRCERRGKIAAKNKGEVEMYFVEAPVDLPTYA